MKNAVFLGINFAILENIDLKNPTFIPEPTESRPINKVPSGINFKKLFIHSPNINLKPSKLINDSTAITDVDDVRVDDTSTAVP